MLTLAVLYNSCNSTKNVNPVTNKSQSAQMKTGKADKSDTTTKAVSSSKKTGPDVVASVHPDAFYITYGSYYYVYVWRFDHYGPKDGKIVGIWPYDNSVSNLTTLRTRWGYSGILVSSQTSYDHAISAGYDLNNMMVNVTGIPDENRYNTISNFGNAFAYYVDEPADQNHSMGGVRDALNQLSFSSLFVISGYKRDDALDVDVEYADVVMFSSYKHWYETLPGVWVSWPVDDDQRPDWSDMQDRYGSKFSMTWISTKEIDEYDDLFGHAQNLGLNGVWIYGYTEDGQPVAHYNDEFTNISAAAYNHGFLRRYARQWKNKYECISPEGTSTFPPGPDWQLIDQESTDVVEER